MQEARRSYRNRLLVGVGLGVLLSLGFIIYVVQTHDERKDRNRGAGYPIDLISNPELTTEQDSINSPRLGLINVNVRPGFDPDRDRTPDDSREKFLTYSPHSNFHNQRIALENALALAFALKRTLLLPPVWLGTAIPYTDYAKLVNRIKRASKVGLEHCKMLGEGNVDENPLPRECLGYFDWTMIAWDYWIDLSEVRKMVKVRDQWNQTNEWLEGELDLSAGDTYNLPDRGLYQYRFYDSPLDQMALTKYSDRVDIDQLATDSRDAKLLRVGSLFGTLRIRLITEENRLAREVIQRSMVFKHQQLDSIAAIIRDKLGGAGNYYALHLRVGDGEFQARAKENMHAIWITMCDQKMQLLKEVCDLAKRKNTKKVSLKDLEVRRLDYESNVEIQRRELAKRSPFASKRYKRPLRDPLSPLRKITSRVDSPLASSLTCRRPLHTVPALLPFNAPLFIATDSKLGSNDPSLSSFFLAFPCTFLLSDFQSLSPYNNELIEGLENLSYLRNEADNVPLAQFLIPNLDAQVAAWGRDCVATPKSTFGQFAVDVLHQVYHNWTIIMRGQP